VVQNYVSILRGVLEPDTHGRTTRSSGRLVRRGVVPPGRGF
jgi:hypothetical protein